MFKQTKERINHTAGGFGAKKKKEKSLGWLVLSSLPVCFKTSNAQRLDKKYMLVI